MIIYLFLPRSRFETNTGSSGPRKKFPIQPDPDSHCFTQDWYRYYITKRMNFIIWIIIIFDIPVASLGPRSVHRSAGARACTWASGGACYDRRCCRWAGSGTGASPGREWAGRGSWGCAGASGASWVGPARSQSGPRPWAGRPGWGGRRGSGAQPAHTALPAHKLRVTQTMTK